MVHNSFIFTNTCTTIMSYFLHPYICFDYLLVICKGVKKYYIIVVHVLVKIKLLLKDKMHGEYNVKNMVHKF